MCFLGVHLKYPPSLYGSRVPPGVEIITFRGVSNCECVTALFKEGGGQFL